MCDTRLFNLVHRCFLAPCSTGTSDVQYVDRCAVRMPQPAPHRAQRLCRQLQEVRDQQTVEDAIEYLDKHEHTPADGAQRVTGADLRLALLEENLVGKTIMSVFRGLMLFKVRHEGVCGLGPAWGVLAQSAPWS